MSGQFASGIPLVLNIFHKECGAGVAANAMRCKTVCHHVMAGTSPEIGWVQPHGLARPAAASMVGLGTDDPDCVPTRLIQSSGGATSITTMSRGVAPERRTREADQNGDAGRRNAVAGACLGFVQRLQSLGAFLDSTLVLRSRHFGQIRCLQECRSVPGTRRRH